MKKMIKFSIAFFLCLLVFVSCDMRELCYNHNEHAYKYQVNIIADYDLEWQYPIEENKDWKEIWPDTFYNVSYADLIPAKPSGLRVLVYDTIALDKQNIESDGGIVYLSEAEKSFLIYNNNTEAIVFDVQDKIEAFATTRGVNRSSYKGNIYSTMSEINSKTEPDVLYVAYVSSYLPISAVSAPNLFVLLNPVVYKYYIRYEFEYGIQHVKMARGSLAGMAGSVNLHSQLACNDLATIMYDAKVRSFGVDSHVNSFGLPSDMASLSSQLDGDYTCALNLEVALVNGYIKTFEFDVTNQILSQPKGGVIVVKGLRVEDEEAKYDGAGFDVTVDSWGPYEDVVLDF